MTSEILLLLQTREGTRVSFRRDGFLFAGTKLQTIDVSRALANGGIVIQQDGRDEADYLALDGTITDVEVSA